MVFPQLRIMAREYSRFPQMIEIQLESASGLREARISDISLGGCFVDTIVSAQEGDVVKFDVRLEDRTFSMVGEVAYVFPGNGFGVKFTDIPDGFEEVLAHSGNLAGD
jgi:hypothetical protein